MATTVAVSPSSADAYAESEVAAIVDEDAPPSDSVTHESVEAAANISELKHDSAVAETTIVAENECSAQQPVSVAIEAD